MTWLSEEKFTLAQRLQKASESAQSHVIVSYDKCGSLGNVGAIAMHAVCGYVMMMV
jgi:hypothetical protein